MSADSEKNGKATSRKAGGVKPRPVLKLAENLFRPLSELSNLAIEEMIQVFLKKKTGPISVDHLILLLACTSEEFNSRLNADSRFAEIIDKALRVSKVRLLDLVADQAAGLNRGNFNASKFLLGVNHDVRDTEQTKVITDNTSKSNINIEYVEVENAS